MKKKYITIAKSLGIVLPACLIASVVEVTAANSENSDIAVFKKEKCAKGTTASNSVKDRIVKSFNSESTFSPYQIDHTNVHADYTIAHSDVHTDYVYNRKHTDIHKHS